MPRYIEELVSEQVRASELARRRDIVTGRPCQHSVITISRRMGSGARIVAQMLAKELGWSLWDKELVNAIAEKGRVSEKLVSEFDEHKISEIDLFARSMFGDHAAGGFVYARHLARAVKSIAELGDAIILGRGANFLIPESLKLRIDASDPVRIRNMMQYEDMTSEAAAAKIHQSDRDRQSFVTSLFGRERVENAIYDISIWMDGFSNEAAVDIIKAAVEHWRQEE